MTQQILGHRERTTPQRRWWEVRAVLWAALLVVCVSGAAVAALPEVRSAVRVTVIEPVVTVSTSVARWEGWPALAVATLAGALAAPVVRRTRA